MPGPIINPHTGRPMGAKPPDPQHAKAGPLPGAQPPPAGPGAPVQADPAQVEAMFRGYQMQKVQALFQEINRVIGEARVDFATAVGVLSVIQTNYANQAVSLAKNTPMGPPPPEVKMTGRNEPPPNPEMSAGGSTTPPEE